MGSTWERFVKELSKFLAVGLLATVVAFVLFNWLVHGLALSGALGQEDPLLNQHPEIAYVIANSIGMLISYRGTKKWAFKHRQTAYADGGFTAFVLINIATMWIPVLCLWVSRNALGLDDPLSDNISANVIGLGLGTMARFYLFKRVVFTEKVMPQAPVEAHSAVQE